MSNPVLSRLAQQLVLAVAPELRDDRPQITIRATRVIRDIKANSQGSARKEWEDVTGTIHGLSRSAKIRVQEDLAEALQKNLHQLEKCRQKGKTSWEGDGEIKLSNLPQYVHLLLNLADKPSTSTHDFAYSYLHRVPPSGPTADQILYRQIMNDEPFDPGEVWDEEVLSGWTESEDESERSLSSDSDGSPTEDEVKTPSSFVLRAQKKKNDELRRREIEEERKQDALEVVRGLKEAYWLKPGQVQAMPDGMYGWKDLITKTNTLSLSRRVIKDGKENDKAITPAQLQRELLFALSGRSGVLFHFNEAGICSITPEHPQVHHLSPHGLDDTLKTFRHYALQAASIRRFNDQVLQPVPFNFNTNSKISNTINFPNKTQQAFAAACRDIMAKFDLWVSELESSFTFGSSPYSSSSSIPGVSAASTPSLLRLEFERRYAALLDVLSALIPHSANATILLNLILTTMTTLHHTQDSIHLSSLRDLFVQTATPTWQMLGVWLQHGMPIPSSLLDPEETYTSTFDNSDERPLETEFFIKRDRDVSWADEDFYESGFVVSEDGWPEWLGEDVGELVLEAGKAKGLLRSLLGGIACDDDWVSLDEVLAITTIVDQVDSSVTRKTEERVNVIEAITNHLKPMCQLTQFHLRRVLDEDCGLEQHLNAIEGLMYHRGFEILYEWTEGLFQKINANEKWADFQTLTSTLRDAIEKQSAGWMNPTAIRIRALRSSGPLVGPRALSILRANYEVPFPLSQLFTSTSIDLRAEVFTLILQLRMARYLLTQSKTLDRDLTARLEDGGEGEIRSMWRMRQKLLWFIDTVHIWLTGQIIDAQSNDFRRKLSEMTSLRSMIAHELEHTRKIRNFCFLHASTSEIYELLQDIFDMVHTLSECFASYLVQSASQTKSKNDFVTQRRPQRRRRRRSREDYSSDEDSGNTYREASISFVALSLGERMNRMSKDTDMYIQQIREGVDALSMNLNGEEDGWAMLSFALEEWK
ncbi:uncharacterized protein IL334_002392 [Kwoniella shivajii]|uniref:Spindle pole body component n=1 Tax=Kwoniella shivajii TaxID=564305 RepID=A0ABZ1CWC0_9TREE|nr:hypothetical protein IL334_002392 [Kwoniella shivajii]